MLRNFICINPLRYVMNRLNMGMTILLQEGTCHSVTPTRSFKSNIELMSQEKFTRDPSRIVKRDGTVIRKKTDPEKMIDLLVDSDISVLTMKAAETIAKSRGLNLIKQHSKPGSTRETYKLVKDSDLAKEDLKETSKESKEIKKHIFSSGISDNDLQTKMKLLVKNLLKHKVVLCTVKSAGDVNEMNRVVEKIKQEIKKTDIPVKFISSKETNIAAQFRAQIVADDSKELELGSQKDKSKEK